MDGTFDRAVFPFTETLHETIKPVQEEKKDQTLFTFSNSVSFKESIKPMSHPVMHSSILPSGGSCPLKGVVDLPPTTSDSL